MASFRTVADAEGYLAELVPGWVPDQLSPAWQQLFDAEAVAVIDPQARAERQQAWGYDGSPGELVAIGRTVIASRYGLEPMVPELGALAWKRGARTVQHAAHLHGCGTVVVAIKCRDGADRARLAATRLPELLPGTTAEVRSYVHGELVIATMPVLNGPRTMKTLEAARDAALALAGGRPFAAELYPAGIEDAALIAAKQRLGEVPAQVPRLCVSFYGQDGEAKAGSFSRMIFDERVTLAGAAVLIDPAPDRKRLAVLGYRQGGYVQALDEARFLLQATVWYESPPRTRGKGKVS